MVSHWHPCQDENKQDAQKAEHPKAPFDACAFISLWFINHNSEQLETIIYVLFVCLLFTLH